jgi:hypothetical protein
MRPLTLAFIDNRYAEGVLMEITDAGVRWRDAVPIPGGRKLNKPSSDIAMRVLGASLTWRTWPA